MTELEALLREFYRVWLRAESCRGCYSCCEPHDCRCPKDRGIGKCECGRDDLNNLENQIEFIIEKEETK